MPILRNDRAICHGPLDNFKRDKYAELLSQKCIGPQKTILSDHFNYYSSRKSLEYLFILSAMNHDTNHLLLDANTGIQLNTIRAVFKHHYSRDICIESSV